MNYDTTLKYKLLCFELSEVSLQVDHVFEIFSKIADLATYST